MNKQGDEIILCGKHTPGHQYGQLDNVNCRVCQLIEQVQSMEMENDETANKLQNLERLMREGKLRIDEDYTDADKKSGPQKLKGDLEFKYRQSIRNYVSIVEERKELKEEIETLKKRVSGLATPCA